MKRRILVPLLVFLLPTAATGAAWALGGRENLTKSSRTVTVQEKDELVGDEITREVVVRGPLAGYFVGLDAVAGVGITCAAAAVLVWRFGFRSTR